MQNATWEFCSFVWRKGQTLDHVVQNRKGKNSSRALKCLQTVLTVKTVPSCLSPRRYIGHHDNIHVPARAKSAAWTVFTGLSRTEIREQVSLCQSKCWNRKPIYCRLFLELWVLGALFNDKQETNCTQQWRQLMMWCLLSCNTLLCEESHQESLISPGDPPASRGTGGCPADRTRCIPGCIQKLAHPWISHWRPDRSAACAAPPWHRSCSRREREGERFKWKFGSNFIFICNFNCVVK